LSENTVLQQITRYISIQLNHSGWCELAVNGQSGKRDNAKNNARCTLARKTTHRRDGQHQDMERTHIEESIRMADDRDK